MNSLAGGMRKFRFVLLERRLRPLRVVDDEGDLGPPFLRPEDVDRMDVDAGPREAPCDLRELAGPIEQFEVQDVVQLVLQPGSRQGPFRRLHIPGHDAQERRLVFGLARDRPDVDRGSGEGFRHPRQLSGLVRHENLELFHGPPTKTRRWNVERARKVFLTRRGWAQGTSRPRSRGKRIASRMFGRSSSFWTNRSRPKPHPPCGGIPYRNAFR